MMCNARFPFLSFFFFFFLYFYRNDFIDLFLKDGGELEDTHRERDWKRWKWRNTERGKRAVEMTSGETLPNGLLCCVNGHGNGNGNDLFFPFPICLFVCFLFIFLFFSLLFLSLLLLVRYPHQMLCCCCYILFLVSSFLRFSYFSSSS